MSAFALEAALTERRTNLLYRLRHIIDSPQGPEVSINGKSCLAFCSNDYLGLANHPDVVAHFQKAAGRYGVGGGASHLIIGHNSAHHRLEEKLAEFTGRPRALLFATGYMANLGVISALLESGDAVFQDRLNHASLLDAGKLSGARMQRYHHGDLVDLERRLKKTSARRKLIVTDGVFSMDGDQAPLQDLAGLAKKYDGWLMVDDAHGFGCIGDGGRGSANNLKLSMEDLPVLVGTLGKAFGTAGAFVAGSSALIETLIQFSRPYIYTTAMPPAIAEATCVSLKILEQESWRRDHLIRLIAYFREGCKALGLPLMDSSTPIQPILVGDIKQTLMLGEQLMDKGILVTPIRPPTVPKGKSRLRVTLSASHSFVHLDRLLEALAEIRGQLAAA